MNTPKEKLTEPKKKVLGYIGLIILFFFLSFGSFYVLHRKFSGGSLNIPVQLFSFPIIASLLGLLLCYYLADALRLYSVIKAMGCKVPFRYIFKLVFINIFISNVTPFATGGGFVQIYFMSKKGMTIGEATAATSIRTILSAMILFTLTPIIIWAEPNQFKMFMNRNMLLGITIASCTVLFFLLLITFWPQVIKHILGGILYIPKTLKWKVAIHLESFNERVGKEIDSFSKGFKHYFRFGGLWAVCSVASTILFLFFLFSFSIVLIKALGYTIPFLTILAVQVVVTFFMYFAPTPGATGIAEGGYGLLFAQLVQNKDILALTFSWRFLTIYIGVIIGIFIFAGEFFKMKKEMPK
ncbi:lysylphosphatidylglycerol synthase transmembrane domain-containing protein [uncultured Sphaerochaeta sp.]|uniref:lysylphosphatidylglycerol synthase transmembrane domain-containing protein n=1 Tax=uncultured Sphaerochaeta sp. TaxID=886478 RepID=UPI002A0A9D63|nr:lysylphosphatidylglycerol synthase transmembrane domain-containing protein [uncultured Sphaerochaeta sp.]